MKFTDTVWAGLELLAHTLEIKNKSDLIEVIERQVLPVAEGETTANELQATKKY